jgi:hypothetical protein
MNTLNSFSICDSFTRKVTIFESEQHEDPEKFLIPDSTPLSSARSLRTPHRMGAATLVNPTVRRSGPSAPPGAPVK